MHTGPDTGYLVAVDRPDNYTCAVLRLDAPPTYFPFILSMSAFLMKKKKINKFFFLNI